MPFDLPRNSHPSLSCDSLCLPYRSPSSIPFPAIKTQPPLTLHFPHRSHHPCFNSAPTRPPVSLSVVAPSPLRPTVSFFGRLAPDPLHLGGAPLSPQQRLLLPQQTAHSHVQQRRRSATSKEETETYGAHKPTSSSSPTQRRPLPSSPKPAPAAAQTQPKHSRRPHLGHTICYLKQRRRRRSKGTELFWKQIQKTRTNQI